MGDCFAYAGATHRTALLFKGEDFDKTDIQSATEAREQKFTRARVGPESHAPQVHLHADFAL